MKRVLKIKKLQQCLALSFYFYICCLLTVTHTLQELALVQAVSVFCVVSEQVPTVHTWPLSVLCASLVLPSSSLYLPRAQSRQAALASDVTYVPNLQTWQPVATLLAICECSSWYVPAEKKEKKKKRKKEKKKKKS